MTETRDPVRHADGGDDNEAGRPERPGVEAGRDVRAPRPDSAKLNAVRDTINLHDNARRKLETLFGSLTDANGNLDLSRVGDDGHYGQINPADLLPDSHYAQPGDPFFDGAVQEATEQYSNVPDGVELRSNLDRQIETNRQKIADATANRDARLADVKKAIQEMADTGPKMKAALALTSILALAGLAGSGVLGYLYLSATECDPGTNTTVAFGVTDDTVEGYQTGKPAFVRVLASDTGVDPATLKLVGADDTGAIVVEGEGTWTIEDEQVKFTPADAFVGSPTPVDYQVTAVTAKDKDGNLRTGTGTVTVIYNGDFDVPSVLVNTYVLGQDSVAIRFLDKAKGADPATAKLVDADDGNELQKTVEGEGVWTLDRDAQTLQFKVAPPFADNPGMIQFSVDSQDGKRTAKRIVLVQGKELDVPDITQKVKPGTAFEIGALSVEGQQLDAASLQILDGDGTPQNPLNVAEEGVWTVSDAGVLSFAPADGFEGLPGPIQATIADEAGQRSKPFTISAMPFVPPRAKNKFIVPPENVELGQRRSVRIRTLEPDDAIPGDFDVDPSTVTILGLMPMGDQIPSARFVTAGKQIEVEGEGTWTVGDNGNTVFETAPNFVRWPTPMAYTVSDVEGNASNVAFISITPDNADLQNAMNEMNAKPDDAFWSDFSDKVLSVDYSLPDILVTCSTLEFMSNAALDRSSMRAINVLPVVDADKLRATLKSFLLDNKGAPQAMVGLTAFIDADHLNGIEDGLGDIPMAARIQRLRLMQTMLRTVLEG